MPIRKTLLISLVFLGLVGCVTVGKPNLPEAMYEQLAWKKVGISRCGQMGLISPEIASLGLAYSDSEFNRYVFDRTKLASVFDGLNRSSESPNITQCNMWAMWVMTVKRSVDINNQIVAEDERAIQSFINSTRPSTTYCNKIGSSVMCNSY